MSEEDIKAKNPVDVTPNQRLYVQNLPYSMTHNDLKRLTHSLVGEECYARILTRNKQSMGAAILKFSDVETATRALNALNGMDIRGRIISARYEMMPSKPEFFGNAVFFYSLPFSITWRDLKDLARGYVNVERADIFSRNGRSMGTGYVVCSSPEDVQTLVQKLNGITLRGREITLKPYSEKNDDDKFQHEPHSEEM